MPSHPANPAPVIPALGGLGPFDGARHRAAAAAVEDYAIERLGCQAADEAGAIPVARLSG